MNTESIVSESIDDLSVGQNNQNPILNQSEKYETNFVVKQCTEAIKPRMYRNRDMQMPPNMDLVCYPISNNQFIC